MTEEAGVDEVTRLRRLVVDSCHILALTGCVREITGNVSVRYPGTTDEMLCRCRRDQDPGVEFTEIQDVRRVDMWGRSDELVDGYQLPGEFSLHSEIYQAHPEVGAVVHGHPRSSLLCSILDLPMLPVFGAYDPPSMELAVIGIPVYPRAPLISTSELGKEVVAAMGDAPVCMLRGHGTVAVGRDVQEATVRTVKLETLAEVVVQAHATGHQPPALPDEDVTDTLAFSKTRGIERKHMLWVWEFYRRLAAARAAARG